MTSGAGQVRVTSRSRAVASLVATALSWACGEGREQAIETLREPNYPALAQLQLSDCELAQLERALQENTEEIALALAQTAALEVEGAKAHGGRAQGARAHGVEARQAPGDKANLHLTIAANGATPNQVAIPGGAPRPDPIAKVEDAKAYFWRPDLGRRYYLVVPNEVPSPYFYAAVLAVYALEGALEDDCLAEVFTVLWQEDYAALHPQLRQRSSRIELGYSELACLNLAAGCSNSPRMAELAIGPGVLERRMRLGSYIGLETDYDTVRDDDDAPDLTPAGARNVLLHELSHILGFEHPRYSELEPALDERNVRVPQSSQGTVPSFLFTTASPLFSPNPTPEDRRVLARVYGGECAYRSDYRLLGEVCSDGNELHCQALGGSCEVARLAGNERHERCRWHNFREEAACARYSAGTWQTSDVSDPDRVFPGEAGACLASELPECVNESFVTTEDDLSGRCCTLFGSSERGLLFEAFASDGLKHYFCSQQKGLGPPPDAWEFSAASELAELSLLDAASGDSVAGWAIHAGELVQERELASNLALSTERMRSGCITTRVTADGAGESGIVFNYRTPGNYYVFDALPNVRRRIRQVSNGVSRELSVEPWPAPRRWSSSVELTVCHGDGIHTFIDGRLSSRVSVEQRVGFFGSGGRLGLWNDRNGGARHAHLRAYSLVEGFALLRR